MRRVNKEIYVCRRIRLYNYLIEHGFYPFAKRRDRDNYKYYVWLFQNSQELQECVTDYYSNIN